MTDLPPPEPLPIAVRAYAPPPPRKPKRGRRRGKKRRRKVPQPIPPSDSTLIFDCETTEDEVHSLRFGSFQVRRAGDLERAGFFYEARTLPAADLRVLEDCAAQHGVEVLELADFVEKVFYHYVYDLGGLCVGFNLPFDLSRIALRNVRSRRSQGFSFELSDEERRHRVRVIHRSSSYAFIQFVPRRGHKRDDHRGHFLDVKTLAKARTGSGHKLTTLADTLETEHRKLEVAEHGGPLDPTYLAYAMQDVQVTWECAEILLDRYARYRLSQTPLPRPPEIGPPRMRVLSARDNGREEDRREEAATHPRADHPQAPGGRADARRGRRDPRGGQGPRGLRADLPPLASAIRRHEGRRRQGASRAAARERLLEAHRRRQGTRERRPEGDRQGKLVSPARRRRAVRMLCDRLSLSERRACQIAGQHRSTQRHEPTQAQDDAALRARLRELSRDRPRWGYRRAHAALLEEGWCLNRKRVQRIWREEGLRVPKRRRKRQRLGESTVPADRLRAERPDQVWALDFQFDQTQDGRILKLLNVVDEHTREALAIECHRRIDADATVAVLDRLVAARGRTPEHVRCDNGPELTANALRDWCRFSRTGGSYIEPGSPWQNPYVESFGSRVRDELLGGELFATLAEAQVLVEDWRVDYNDRRPHSALGMMAPARFAASWRRSDQQINRLSLAVDR